MLKAFVEFIQTLAMKYQKSINSIVFSAASERSYFNYRAKFARYLEDYYQMIHKPRVKWYRKLVDAIVPYNQQTVVITSDGRTSIFYLCLVRCNQAIILNGLGSYEKSYFVRWLLINANFFKKNIVIFSQSHRDFRYIRRYSRVAVYWVPGSGGTERLLGKSRVPLLITRGRKLRKMRRNVEEALKIFKEIDVVGVKKSRKTDIFEKLNLKGRKIQNEIFDTSEVFLQVDGYGEGIPHTLVDAICSNMDVFIHRKCWIKFGFYKYTTNYDELELIHDQYYFIHRSSDIHARLKSVVNEKAIFSKLHNLLRCHRFQIN